MLAGIGTGVLAFEGVQYRPWDAECIISTGTLFRAVSYCCRKSTGSRSYTTPLLAGIAEESYLQLHLWLATTCQSMCKVHIRSSSSILYHAALVRYIAGCVNTSMAAKGALESLTKTDILKTAMI